MSSPTLWDDLKALRTLSKHIGVLHETQIKQLKYWPRVVYGHSKTSEFSYDPEELEIEFRLTTEGDEPADLVKRNKAFDAMVKHLIGENFRVIVKVGDKVLLDSPGINLMGIRP